MKTAIEKQDVTHEDGFDPDPLHSMTLGYLVNLIARLMAQALKARNGPDGILPGQYPIALELLMRDGMSQRDLCEAVRIEQTTMANTLKRMERDGLIVRRQSAEDGRLSTVHLTPMAASWPARPWTTWRRSTAWLSKASTGTPRRSFAIPSLPLRSASNRICAAEASIMPRQLPYF